MTRPTLVISIGGAICAALFVFAFIAAPQSCEWGLTAYFWSGVASLIVLLAVPMVVRTDRSIPGRVALGLGLAALGVAVWVAGLFAANVRIMCRLF